jgi:hypothetical protein
MRRSIQTGALGRHASGLAGRVRARRELSQTTHNQWVKSRGRAAPAAAEFYPSARETQTKVNREPAPNRPPRGGSLCHRI